jgi:hypothetical protein
LLLEYELDKEGNRIIDFSYGKGGYWNIDYQYRAAITKTDSTPINEQVIKKDLFVDNYSDLGLHDAGIFDPPYIYGHQVFNYQTPTSMQKQGKNSWGNDPRFSENKNPEQFRDRVIAVNKAALQCIKPGGLLFVKVMDTRFKGKLILNHDIIQDNLMAFECYAIYIYLAGGAHTWKHHAENSHGYWMVFKMTNQTTL